MRSVTSTRARLGRHVSALKRCTTCPDMQRPVVSGGAIVSKVLLVGQAPGDKEPKMGRPFAWTAGRTLFRWFREATGLDEATFRSGIYMAAVCRCFPGKKPRGGDRVPTRQEIANCSGWLDAEFQILRPELVIPVGKLAIEQFVVCPSLSEVVGKQLRIRFADHETDLIPIPHPSGASPWPRMEPGKSLLQDALRLIARHPALDNIKAPSVASRRRMLRLEPVPISLKRVYETPSRSDGCRILVDRLWPRGLSKEDAKVDLWSKEAAPSTELRRWFNHEPDKWAEFKRRYFRELASREGSLHPILERVRSGQVTFVFASRESRFNNVVALKEYIDRLT